MKLEQTFEVAEWEETGETGFKPVPSGDDWDPLAYAPGLAHDFMEHAGQFSLRGETKAHAAMFFMRYETGYCPRLPYAKPLDLNSFSQEWVTLYRGMEQGATLSECKPQEKLDDMQEEELAEIVSKGKRAILAEIEREWLNVDAYAMLSKHYAEWFRKGYHEAAARYSRIGAHGAQFAFDQVLQYFLGQLSGELQSGNKVNISLDLETGELTFQEINQCWTCGNDCEDETCEDCQEYDKEEEEPLTYEQLGIE
jgi:hypothetical protein